MKAIELINDLTKNIEVPGVSCDYVKAGDTGKTIKKVAVSMFATVDVVKRVKEWGADMLIVHEPTYYDHMENIPTMTKTIELKKKLIEDSGIVVYRYHDHMHYMDYDAITEGMLHYLGLTGKVEKTKWFASYVFTSDKEVSASELAEKMQNDLGIAHVKIAGGTDFKTKKIAACFGTPGGVFEMLCDDDIDIVLTGEACEWKLGEYARDSYALGINKSLIVMGHIGSERDGMKYLCEKMKKKYAEFETEYFECSEVYSYKDT